MSADSIRTADPNILGATDGDGVEHKGDIPTGEYRQVRFITPDGDEAGITVGDTLIANGETHGDVREIIRHPSNVHGPAWHWTVYFDYSDGANGGAPLGELADQIDDGAVYHEGEV